MMYCPKCGAAYRDEMTICPLCGVPLEERKPASGSMPADCKIKTPVVLTTTATAGEAEMICGVLRESGIACYVHPKNEALKVYMGDSLFGSEVVVDQQSLTHAGDVLEEMKQASAVPEEELARQALDGLPEEELAAQAETEPRQPMTDNGPMLLIRVLILLFVIATVVALLLGNRAQLGFLFP